MARNSEVLISEDPRGLSRANGVSAVALAAGLIVMMQPASAAVEGTSAVVSLPYPTGYLDLSENAVSFDIDVGVGMPATLVVDGSSAVDAEAVTGDEFALQLQDLISLDGVLDAAISARFDGENVVIETLATGSDAQIEVSNFDNAPAEWFPISANGTDAVPGSEEGYVPFSAAASDNVKSTVAVNLNKADAGEMITVIDCIAQIKDVLTIWPSDDEDEAEARALLAAKFVKAR